MVGRSEKAKSPEFRDGEVHGSEFSELRFNRCAGCSAVGIDHLGGGVTGACSDPAFGLSVGQGEGHEGASEVVIPDGTALLRVCKKFRVCPDRPGRPTFEILNCLGAEGGKCWK